MQKIGLEGAPESNVFWPCLRSPVIWWLLPKSEPFCLKSHWNFCKIKKFLQSLDKVFYTFAREFPKIYSKSAWNVCKVLIKCLRKFYRNLFLNQKNWFEISLEWFNMYFFYTERKNFIQNSSKFSPNFQIIFLILLFFNNYYSSKIFKFSRNFLKIFSKIRNVFKIFSNYSYNLPKVLSYFYEIR